MRNLITLYASTDKAFRHGSRQASTIELNVQRSEVKFAVKDGRLLHGDPGSGATIYGARFFVGAIALTLSLSSCTSLPLREGATLVSYAHLSPTKGKFTKSRTYVDANSLSAVRTVAIVPATFSANASSKVKTNQNRALVSNALDRSICVALSDKYEIVSGGAPADLTVRTVITDIVPTDKSIAGVSTVVSLGSSLVLPIGVPRLPIGLGGLAAEAEAIDSTGTQRAALVWSKGANSFTDNARVSEIGDAYGLASDFGNFFSRLLISGKDADGLDLSLPSGQRLRSALGGKPKYAACEAFGRSPGLAGMVADQFGAPPQLTDKAPKVVAR